MKSYFLKLFGNTQTVEIINFLIENKEFEYSIEEIAYVLNNLDLAIEDEVKHLNSLGLLLIENEKIKLDPKNKVVKHIMEIDSLLTI